MSALSEGPPLAVIPRSLALVEGTFLTRYKRFLADVRLATTGEVVTAHCVNTGAMEGLTHPGGRVWLSLAENPARKLRYTWELAEVDGRIFGVNTSMPNRIVGHLLREGRLPWHRRPWDEVRAEVRYGERSRVDFRLTRGKSLHYLEVKNCHLIYPDDRAYFPDCVSERATGHLHELVKVTQAGHTAEVVFCVQTPRVRSVRPSDVHDPAFAIAARAAREAGVRFHAIAVSHTPDSIIVHRAVPVELKPYHTSRVTRWRTEAVASAKQRLGESRTPSPQDPSI